MVTAVLTENLHTSSISRHSLSMCPLSHSMQHIIPKFLTNLVTKTYRRYGEARILVSFHIHFAALNFLERRQDLRNVRILLRVQVSNSGKCFLASFMISSTRCLGCREMGILQSIRDSISCFTYACKENKMN